MRRRRRSRLFVPRGGYVTEGMTARTQAENACAPVGMEGALRIAKERRFSLSATMLTGENITVKCENNPNGQMAFFNTHTKQIMLNEGDKRLDFRDPVKGLIYTRASLYHEIDHALFTRDVNGKVQRLSQAAKDPSAFGMLRNILEDGRIERLGKMKFAGQADFLNTSLMDMVSNLGPTELDGLHLYVRTGMFRNKHEANYWQPHKAQIDKAVKALSTSSMLDIAFDIAQAIGKDRPQQGGGGEGETQQGDSGESAQGGDKPQGDKGAGDSESEQQSEGEGEGDANESGASDASEASDESQGGDDANGEGESVSADESDEGAGEAQGEGEGQDSGESEQSDSGQSSGGAGPTDAQSGELDEEIADALEKIVETAIKNCQAEAESDYEAIVAEAEAYEPEQAFVTSAESAASSDLASAFTSLLVESARTRYYSARAGLLNQAALSNALTSRKCFHKREETPNTPHVVLLLDVSYSMNGRIAELTSAARVLNGALREAKLNLKVMTFGGNGPWDALNEFKTIPERPLVTHGGTPAHLAMEAANNWLENEGATRGLIIVVTDGCPDDLKASQAQLQRSQAANSFVVGVLIGLNPAPEIPANYPESIKQDVREDHAKMLTNLTAQFDTHAFCPNVAELPSVIQPMLAEYITGG